MQSQKLERLPELDALRGLFLVWMTVTHLPTQFSDLVNQPLGFVSSAEGFVFISAILVGRLYVRGFTTDPRTVRAKLWRRTLKIYAYQLAMLALAFTVVAQIALHTHQAALLNLLDFYLAHRQTAIIGGLLLFYCPPILDILPMYIVFLFFTPLVLMAAVRWGWRWVLAGTGTVWIMAQFGLRILVHNWVVHVTHLNIPLQETGAFNLFAWQGVWIVGLWLGAKSATDIVPLDNIPGWVVGLAGAVCLFFIGVRFGWFGPHLTSESLGPKLDKWQIGPLRVVNLTAFTIFAYASRGYVLKLIHREPFVTLGKASLRVFCAHIVFVIVGLTMLYGDFDSDGLDQLHGWRAVVLLAGTFAALIWVASDEVRRKRAQKKRRNSARQDVAADQGTELAKSGTYS